MTNPAALIPTFESREAVVFGIGRAVKRALRRKEASSPVPFVAPAVEEIADPGHVPCIAPVVEEVQDRHLSDAAVLARAEETLASAIALGREGRFIVVPELISVSATGNCNLRCIMCPGHSGMTGPRLSVEQADSLFGAFGTNRTDFGSTKWLDMTAGEPLLNTQLHIIFRNFRASVPQGKIQIISNATLPIKGRVKEALDLCDSIGLSIDGATKETYERIRKGSRFENVIRNIRDVADLKQKGKGCDHLTLMFVVMDQNAHELPQLVRLAADLGMPAVFAQAVEVRTTPFLEQGDNMNFDMPAAELRAYIEEAQAEADRLGVRFHPTNGLLSKARSEAFEGLNTDLSTTKTDFSTGVKLCKVPWIHSSRFVLEADGVQLSSVCCHMPEFMKEGNLRHRPELAGKSINAIYNSDAYWDIRAGLLDGTLAKGACRGCQYYESTQWTADQLRELEAAVANVKMRSEETVQ